MVKLWPILINGYRPPVATANPRIAQLTALDDLFAHYPILTMVHILPGLLFMILGPLQFSSTIRKRYLRWYRWNGQVYVVCGGVIDVTTLGMSFAMPAIGRFNQAAATTLFGSFFYSRLGKPSGISGATRLTCIASG